MFIPVTSFSDLLCHLDRSSREREDVLVLQVLVLDLRDPRSVFLSAIEFLHDLGQVSLVDIQKST